MSALDFILAKAIGKKAADAEYYHLLDSCESDLSKLQSQLMGLRTEVDTLAQAIRCESFPSADQVPAFQAIIQGAHSEFGRIEDVLQQREVEKEAFRMRHGLTRPPQNSDATAGALQVGGLAVLEAITSAGFLYNAHLAGGPFEALSASALISAAKMSFSLMAGYFAGRYWNYGCDALDRDDDEFIRRRTWARIAGVTSAITIGWLHLCIGCVRQQETFDIDHSLGSYLDVITTPESLLLMMMGGVFSVFAWFKGMKSFSDSYPGYSERAKGIGDALFSLDDTLEDAKEDLEDAYGEELDQLSGFKASLQEKISEHNAALNRYLVAEQQIRSQVQRAETKLRAEMSQISDVQLMARSDHTEPSALPHQLEAQLSLDRFVPGEPPKPFQLPDFSEHERALLAAKGRALEALVQLHDQTQPKKEEDHNG